MKVIIGSDHAGFELKSELIKYLTDKNFGVYDKGTFSIESVDYPDYAHVVASEISKDEMSVGILICGSANGVSITANKHDRVRCAICWNVEVAELARKHNNANILALPARFINKEVAKQITEKFLVTDFEGGRHLKRINKIEC